MIFSYCQKCGLYITVPDEFAGGAGSCPRCKISLQIPAPLGDDSPYYVAGLRYISHLAGAAGAEGLPLIAVSALGPSLRYECPHCEEKYESLAAQGFRQGTCPKCGAVNTPAGNEAQFPRKFRTPEDGTAPVQMEGEFLLAQPSTDQTPSDSIIVGVIIPEGGAVEEEPIEVPGKKAQELPPASEVPDVPNHLKWSYLVKGKPAGPVSVRELKKLQETSKINPSTPVWQHGMDGWVPIEKFPQLLYKPEQGDQNTKNSKAKSQLTQHQLSQYLLRRCQLIFWFFVAVVSFLVLMLVTKQTFSDLGPETIPMVSAGLAFAILCILIYGIIFVGVNSKRMKILPSVIRIQSFGGVVGLTGCLVITLLFGFQPIKENLYTQTHVQWSIRRAKELTEFFEQDKLRQSHKFVQWNEFKFNGDDIGAKYKKAQTPAEQNKVIAVVFAAFNEAMKPPPPKPKPKPSDDPKNLATTPKADGDESPDKIVPEKPKKVEPPHLMGWRVVPNFKLTIVEAVNSANRNKFIFAFDIGRLIELTIKIPPKKPAEKTKDDKKPN